MKRNNNPGTTQFNTKEGGETIMRNFDPYFILPLTVSIVAIAINIVVLLAK